MAITAIQVWAEMGVPPADLESQDGVNMRAVVDGVNASVPNSVPRVRELADDQPWPDDIVRGAVMQAARLFARRNSPTGVAAYTDAGPAYVAKWDPDVERLFGIGLWATPRLG